MYNDHTMRHNLSRYRVKMQDIAPMYGRSLRPKSPWGLNMEASVTSASLDFHEIPQVIKLCNFYDFLFHLFISVFILKPKIVLVQKIRACVSD